MCVYFIGGRFPSDTVAVRVKVSTHLNRTSFSPIHLVHEPYKSYKEYINICSVHIELF